jgi:hypothetical protein
MQRICWRASALVLISCFLAACQTLPQVPYDRAAAGNVKTIAVITPGTPDRPHVVLASTVGQSFGLIGALIDAGMQDSRESKFQAVVAQRNFKGQDAMIKQLDAALVADGYTPVDTTVTRAGQGFAKDYQQAPGSTDAYIDVVMNYGYYAAGLSTPYRPFVFVDVKLVRTSDKALLMQKSIFYNPLNNAPSQTVTLAPDPAYEFADFDALMADPDRAVKGLDNAVTQVAATMGTLLK